MLNADQCVILSTQEYNMYEFNNFYNKVVNSRVDSMPAVEGVWSRHDGLAGWNVELSEVR